MYEFEYIYNLAGEPLDHSKTISVCFNRNFTMFCEISQVHVGKYENVYWIFNRNLLLVNGYYVYNTSSDGTQLVINNVTTNATGDYDCYIELNDGTFINGTTYSLHPLGRY